MALFHEETKKLALKNDQINLTDDDKEKLKKLKRRTDVNFVKNLQFHELPKGFGTYQSGVEIDSVHARMEVCINAAANQAQAVSVQDQDLNKAKRREEEQDLMANRVISKFNNNSQRILKMLVN